MTASALAFAMAAVVLGVAAGVGIGVVLSRKAAAAMSGASATSTSEAVAAAVAQVQHQAALDRDTAVQAALAHSAVLQRDQVGTQLLDTRLDQVQVEVRAQLRHLGELVGQLGRRNAEQFGKVDEGLRTQAEITRALSSSTQSLREALANPKARGQWGERMAEDVLRLAGFVEHVNYEKQTAVTGTRALPDYTFVMPKGHVLYMDVKFPLSAYLRYLEAGTESERGAHRDAFLRDVRTRVRELSAREYSSIGDRPTVDYVLLFLPNESIAGFIHENDPDLVEHALGQKVVLCSPLTLFAFLGVIRQAFDNFVIEKTSDEILVLLGRFGQQWTKYKESLDAVGRKFDAVHKELENLSGTRRRMLERPLVQLEELRRERGLEIDGELPGAEVLELEGLREDRGA